MRPPQHVGLNATTGSPSSPMNHTTKDWFTFHYRNPSRQNPEPLQQQSESQPTTGLGAPERLQVTTTVSTTTMASRVQRSKSNKLTNFHFHESSWRAQTDAQKQWQNTRSAQVVHSQIPPKATNAYGGRREEEQRRTQ